MKESKTGLGTCGCSRCRSGLHSSPAASRFLKKQMKRLRRRKLKKYYSNENSRVKGMPSHSFYND